MKAIASLNPYISIVALSLLYCVGLGVYRLYLSPLAKFPGPRFAALTLWFEFYYDVIVCAVLLLRHSFRRVRCISLSPRCRVWLTS